MPFTLYYTAYKPDTQLQYRPKLLGPSSRGQISHGVIFADILITFTVSLIYAAREFFYANREVVCGVF